MPTIIDGSNSAVFNTPLPIAQGGTNVNTSPAFSAYQSTAQAALAAATYTKLLFQTKLFDTASAFDAVTNNRFTPLVAGYYQINAALQISGSSTQVFIVIAKNGLTVLQGNQVAVTSSNAISTVSGLLFLNGSTDYVEIYGYTGTSQPPIAGAAATYFQSFLAKAA